MKKELSPDKEAKGIRKSRLPLAILALTIMMEIGLEVAPAATITWSGTTNTNFATATNWVGDIAPTASDVAAFNGTVAPANQPARLSGAALTLASGLVGGDNYAVTLTLTQNAGAPSLAFGLGADGITTGASAFTITNGATLTNRPLTLNLTADQTWNIGAGGLTLASGSSTIGVSGTSLLTKSGAGTLTYSGVNNAYSGTIAITQGTVTTTADSGSIITAPAVFSNVYVLNGSTAVLSINAALGSLRGVYVDAGGGTFLARNGGTSGNQSFSANNQFNGTGAFTIDLSSYGSDPTQTSVLTISGTNIGYTGHLTIVAAGEDRVTASTNSALGDGSNANHAVTIVSSNTAADSLAISNGINLTIGTLSGNANAKISTVAGASNSGTLTVNQYSSGTYAGTFTRGATSGGSFRLVKSGTGTLTLSGNSGATWDKGGVTINAGTLVIASNSALGASVVAVALNNATLASTANGLALSNTVTTAGTGSILQPTGTFTLGSLNAAAGATLSLDSTEVLTLSNSFTGAGTGGFILDLASGFTLGSPITIINFGSQTGVDASDFVLSAAASSLYSLGSVTIDGDSVDISLSAVPEPATMALVMGGLALVALVARRRKRIGTSL
ncbi:hypothetical protein BH09VER1_BH09VER1_07430 [soil metagenome]